MFAAFFQFMAAQMLYLALHLESGSFPKPLTKEEEAECFKALEKGDEKARDKLISHNLRLVAHVAKKYYPGAADTDDLISIGTIGLIKAVESFDGDKKTRFSTYAARCIENEILMFFRSGRRTANTISLNEPIDSDHGDSDLTVGDVLHDEMQLEELCERKADAAQLAQLVNCELEPRERQVIRLRYGLGGQQPLTQQQVAVMLGISRSYVSRIEKKAVSWLRRQMEQNEKAGGMKNKNERKM